MPELPEVETVKRGLEKLLVGHTITDVDFDWPKGFPNAPGDVGQFLVGAKVSGIRRRAKVLLLDLDTDYTIVIHLKMTGQFVFVRSRHSRTQSVLSINSGGNPDKKTHGSQIKSGMTNVRFGAGHPNDSLIGKLPDSSTRVTFTLDKDSKLFFNDQRKFGWVKLFPTVEVPSIDFMKKLGPEPLEVDFTAEIFMERLGKRKNTTIKAALLDQTVVAGIGNIYADESLWGAKIHPATKVIDVPARKLKKLFTEIRYVLNLAIEKGGSTDRNYANAEGKRGSYIDFARVFRKEGQPCPRHPGTLIEKTKVAGRGTHICPVCQLVS